MKTLVLMLCGMAVWAVTPLNGTWKLNREKSVAQGALPSFIHGDAISFGPAGPIEVPPAHFLVQDPYGERNLYRVDVSADQRTLTVTRVLSYEDQSGKQFHTVLILEKR
jgi:hypothetical protein